MFRSEQSQGICKGIARTQSPTNKNYAFELPTFGVIVGVNQTVVQWKGLTLEEPPSWSGLTSTPGKYAVEMSFRSLYTQFQHFVLWFKLFTCIPLLKPSHDFIQNYLQISLIFINSVNNSSWSKKTSLDTWCLVPSVLREEKTFVKHLGSFSIISGASIGLSCK